MCTAPRPEPGERRRRTPQRGAYMPRDEDTPGPAPAPTAVVTSFLLRRSSQGDEILLQRRSGRVRTYQGAWAGVSGYLEPGVTPLEQAYTEIGEETGLARDQVALLVTGAPMPVQDTAHSLSWVVHPFLFPED